LAGRRGDAVVAAFDDLRGSAVALGRAEALNHVTERLIGIATPSSCKRAADSGATRSIAVVARSTTEATISVPTA
jgi:hypothetical protein